MSSYIQCQPFILKLKTPYGKSFEVLKSCKPCRDFKNVLQNASLFATLEPDDNENDFEFEDDYEVSVSSFDR